MTIQVVMILVTFMNMCIKCVSSVTDVVGNRPMPTLVDQKALLKVIYHTYVLLGEPSVHVLGALR